MTQEAEAAMESTTIERAYGKYHVKICFAEQDVPNAENQLLDLIMQAYLQRITPEIR